MITSLSWENFQDYLEICMIVFYETRGFSAQMCVKSIHNPVAHLHPIPLAPNSYHFHFILSPWRFDSIIVHLEEQQFSNKSQSLRLKRHTKGYKKEQNLWNILKEKLKILLRNPHPLRTDSMNNSIINTNSNNRLYVGKKFPVPPNLPKSLFTKGLWKSLYQ